LTGSLQEKIIVEIEGQRIDLTEEILAVWPNSLIHIDPETLFEFTPSERYPGEAATIANLVEQISKRLNDRKIGPTIEILTEISKVINALIRSGKIEIIIARDRVFRGLPFMALKLTEK